MTASGRRDAGFTLVEVLVALAVVAFALAALWKGLSQGIAISQGLPDRLMARWVAENRVVLHQARKDWPETRTYEGSSEMGGREWFWREQVRETEEEALRRISVEVGPGEDERDLASLEGFLRQPREETPTGNQGPGNQGRGNQAPGEQRPGGQGPVEQGREQP
ncbi:type II secretion system minor pseudopilin GspI [Thiohalorhabdus denitrificans]|uniref:Type II secretion system protein I n=1 Tax=Thiohalorhabdus denitrificans TaxID=381306 RepID=A0A1G5DP91_9GAMM|nr:type II secretion system minor pseudopilin GspI [Thiohalorhabdus denitrificans]SCY16407.1 general secretion pathway protein I [Thiohalorhabdus denitrificans]